MVISSNVIMVILTIVELARGTPLLPLVLLEGRGPLLLGPLALFLGALLLLGALALEELVSRCSMF